MEKGNISVHTENIFPIIKKFLYSDHEIFLRELVSNAVDATQKLKTLAALGEAKGELGELKIKVSVDKEAKTITISDQGVGMTEEEIKKYINQIAFSGAEEFLEKYKDKNDNQIIGHFGLGFYSAFMVAEKVEIVTKSYLEGAPAVRWVCEGSTSYEITEADKSERGTEVILHIADDSLEFLENSRLQNILDKYCRFLPVEVEFEGRVINNTKPIWTKKPSELNPEDYQSFYKELYPFSEPPLFWIHLNVDYPFNLTGILYFPKIKNDFEPQKNKIQLYSNQVFITDSVKDVVPEFLMLLHGVIDSPDIPLNVSRSFLQSDANVKKISSHITKKVADKLQEMFNADRNDFTEKWEYTGLFVKYGMLTDDKFYEKAVNFGLLQNTKGEYSTISEYIEKVKPVQTDKNGKVVLLYTSDLGVQDSFIQAVLKRGYDVLKMDGQLDNHFVGLLESKNEQLRMVRVDSESLDKLIDKGDTSESVLSEKEQEELKTLFTSHVNNPSFRVETAALAPDDQPVLITRPEFERRMKDMASMGGMSFYGAMPDSYRVIVNTNHPVSRKIVSAGSGEVKTQMVQQAFDLALLSQNMLNGEKLTEFIKRSVEILEK
jgi:molecular chaperone HtpG